MILNVSGRTDIIAFYTPWFLKRLEEGFVDVRNPFYPKKISRIYFSDVDMFVFCTKNPLPILSHLNNIKKPILFHITLTPYKKDIEPNVPDKKQIINAIKKLSKILGKENVYVRYDPILINSFYTVEYHIKAFQKLCSLLDGFVSHIIIISFIDLYKNVEKNARTLNLKEINEQDYKVLGEELSKISHEHGITIQTCFEKGLEKYGFSNRSCVSKELALEKTGKKFPKWQARNCGCALMVDIGEYNTCQHFCKYCYANYDEIKVKKNYQKHNPNSSLLIGNLQKDDEITVRKK